VGFCRARRNQPSRAIEPTASEGQGLDEVRSGQLSTAACPLGLGSWTGLPRAGSSALQAADRRALIGRTLCPRVENGQSPAALVAGRG